MGSIKVAKRDAMNLRSDHTVRGSKNTNTYQSSSISRVPVLDRPRSSHLNCHPGALEPVSDMLGRLRRLNTLRLQLEKVEKSLSVLLTHNPCSICRLPFSTILQICNLDDHRDNSNPVSDVFGPEVFDHLRRLHLELQGVERTLSVLDMNRIHPTPRVLFVDNEFDYHPRDLTFSDLFGSDFFGLHGFVRFELQKVERNLALLQEICWRQKCYRRQRIIEPWTEFPIERKQSSPDAYRPFIFQYSGREHKDHIVRQTTNLDHLQPQREPLDDWAIGSLIDMNWSSLEKVSKWRLWEGKSKEWRRCKVLKVLSSTPFDTLAIKGKMPYCLQWEKGGTTAPIAMLQRNPRVRKVHVPKKDTAKQWRRKDPYKSSWRARVLEIEGEAFCDEPIEPAAPSDEPVCSFENIRREMPAASPSLIPYENYIGAILGGQFQLGHLIRQESDGDVYLVDSLNESILNLEAKAYTLGGLSKSQRKATKKLRQRLCSIDQAGKKFVVYRVDAKSQDSREQQQRSLLQTADAHSSHSRPYRSSVAQLHRSSRTERAGEVETEKDGSKIIVARRSKQLTPNAGDSLDEADGNFYVTDVRTRQQKRLITKKAPKLPAMRAVDNSQEKDVPEKKKRKQRNRGLKKAKVPRFSTLWELQSFLAIIDSRLTLRRRELSPERLWHKKMAKTTAAMQRQHDTLSSRFFRAQKKEEDWDILRGKLSHELHQWIPIIEEEQLDLEETSWTLRKNPPFGARSDKKRSKPLPLLNHYQVFSFEDLDDLDCERMEEIEKILNGEEGLYRRL